MDLSLQLGQKIKSYRLARGLTIKELAEASQITSSMLSQIERGQASPSLNTIRLLSIALAEPLYRFFLDSPDIQSDVVRKENRRQLIDQGIHYEVLTPDMNGTIEMMQLTLPPKAKSRQEPLAHKGEEVALVQAGTVELTLNFETCVLYAGDSVRIKSETKHTWQNVGEEPAVVIFAVSPPSF